MRLDLYHHVSPQIEQKLDAILHKLNRMELRMSASDDIIDRLATDVSNQTTQIESMKVFIVNLKNEVANALAGENISAASKAKLAAIFPALETNTADIVAAINENTPVADKTPAPDFQPQSDPTQPVPVDPSQPATAPPGPGNPSSTLSGSTVTP